MYNITCNVILTDVIIKEVVMEGNKEALTPQGPASHGNKDD